MRKILLLCAAALSLHSASASVSVTDTIVSPISHYSSDVANEMLRPIQPTYAKGVLTESPWSGHWFVGISGGASTFIGKPVGCNDMFGRLKPTYTLAVGKWFTPSVGTRVVFQGGDFKDANNATHGYQHYHADFLWNVLGGRVCRKENQRWELTPFIGIGTIHNSDRGHYPLAVNYGIQTQCHINKRISANVELGNTTTCQHFDGVGSSHRPGDNMLSLSAGLTFHIGRTAWKRVVDAEPYIRQNDWLLSYSHTLKDAYRRYYSLHERDTRSLAQLKRILEIEGLLNKWKHLFDTSTDGQLRDYPRNDYSGLNSLRARLKNRQWDGKELLDGEERKENPADVFANVQESTQGADGDYLALIQGGSRSIGSPIFFFFELGTTRLTDSSQSLNLDELSRVAILYGLTVKVTGAADSATGTQDINTSLGSARADAIAKELTDRGIATDKIKTVNRGGIDKYSPDKVNRHTKVELFLR